LNQLSESEKNKEEYARQLKKYQGSSATLQREIQEASLSRDNLSKQIKELEKRLKLAENNVSQLTDDLAQSERIKRTLTIEKDEALEEIASAIMARDTAVADKKRIESSLSALNIDYDESQLFISELEDKLKKSMLQLEQTQNDLNTERQVITRLENQKATSERLNKELHEKIEELEMEAGKKYKATAAALQQKIQSLDSLLDSKIEEINQANRNNKKLERKLKEIMSLMSDEQRRADNAIEQIEKATGRYKKAERNLQMELENNSALTTQNRRLQRDLEEANETKEAREQEIKVLQTKIERLERRNRGRQTRGGDPSSDDGLPGDSDSVTDSGLGTVNEN